jgi:type I restriction-modification system DNA methylase subunit
MEDILKEIECRDNFLKFLRNIDHTKRDREIFADWLIMAAAALYSWKKDMKVEEEYLQVAKKYTKEQLNNLAKLLGIVITLYEEHGPRDFLGDIFMQLNLFNRKFGQVFTPSNISDMIAEMSAPFEIIKQRKIATVFDPACGSGVMLISMANILRKQDTEYYKYILLVGQDIDPICSYMTFIQLSIIGVPAIIKCGNSLIDEVIWQRETVWCYEYNIGERLLKQRKKEGVSKKASLVKRLFQKELF